MDRTVRVQEAPKYVRKKPIKPKRERFEPEDYSREFLLQSFRTFVRIEYGTLAEELYGKGEYFAPSSNEFSADLVWESKLRERFRNVLDGEAYYDGMLYGFGLAHRVLRGVLQRLKPTLNLSEHVRDREKLLKTLTVEQRKEFKRLSPSPFPADTERQARKRMKGKGDTKEPKRLAGKLSLCLDTDFDKKTPYLNLVAAKLRVSEQEIRDCLKFCRRPVSIEKGKKGRDFLVA